MVFSAFQNVSLKIFVLFQALFFVLLAGGNWYFGFQFPSFILGFGLGQIFSFTSLWLGKRLFGRKINLATLGFMAFKWGILVYALYFTLQRVDRAAFLLGIFGMVSFQIAFALGAMMNKQERF